MKKILIVIVIALLLSVVVLFTGVQSAEAYESGPYNGSVYAAESEEGTYGKFIEGVTPEYNDTEVIIDAKNGYTFKHDEDYIEDDVAIMTEDGKEGLYIPELGNVSWKVNIPSSGYYNIKVTYYAISDRSSNISKGIMINDEYQFVEAKHIVLPRIWQDEFDVAEKREEKKHDIKPAQIEKLRWNTESIRDTNGHYSGNYLFYFEEGENKLTLVGDKEPVIISEISIYHDKKIESYKTVLASLEQEGYQKKSSGEVVFKRQAENAYEKSTPSLTPKASYFSYNVEPYENFITRYNILGGSTWRIAGEWASWIVEVPESGLYQISLKAIQNFQRGLQSTRILYVNGEIPFEEASRITFDYDSDWQNITLGNENGAYWFYLHEGENEIKLEATIGIYGSTVRKVNEVIADLNWMYRKVIMTTGVSPSKYQDYRLFDRIEGLKDTIEKNVKVLDNCVDEVIAIAGERSDLISSLERTQFQLEKFLETEKNIQIGLNELETNITSLGTWVSTVSEQPVGIDYICVHGENTKLPKATTNFFQKLWHELVLLVGSFGADTSLKSSVKADGPTITVWVMTGQDQSNLLRQLIDESFTMQHNINVELKLVSGSVLLPATLAGNGPDVAIGVGSNIPVNWGVRNSVVDLSKLEGFEETLTWFHESAYTPFQFNGATYALPDTQDFYVTFVRDDIFKDPSLNLVDEEGKTITPDNWDEVIDILPILQRQSLDYYIPNSTGSLSPVMYAMVEQYGGTLYLNNGAESGMLQKESSHAFYDFVNFYANYGFAIEANFTNRFRTGEMPIGITSFSLYNTLAVSAPEIRGNWSFAPFPGTLNEDGTTTYATPSSSGGTIILAQTKELEASWEFVKWWVGEEAQTNYARGMEAILGAAARYATANLAAFENLPWSSKEYRLLESQRKLAVGMPVVPGDYIVGRYIDNAFRKVINDKVNPSDSLFNYHQMINNELARKRKEFGLE